MLSEQATVGLWTMEQELFSFVICVKSLSPYLLGKIYYSQNGPQELGILFKFDCTQTNEMEGPALGVSFSNQADPGNPECSSR